MIIKSGLVSLKTPFQHILDDSTYCFTAFGPIICATFDGSDVSSHGEEVGKISLS